MFEVDLSPCQKISLGRLTSFFGGVLIGLLPDHCLGKSTLFAYHCQIKSWQLHHFIRLLFTKTLCPLLYAIIHVYGIEGMIF
jgi:hypothetical protein